jgi:hypothetical protein
MLEGDSRLIFRIEIGPGTWKVELGHGALELAGGIEAMGTYIDT